MIHSTRQNYFPPFTINVEFIFKACQYNTTTPSYLPYLMDTACKNTLHPTQSKTYTFTDTSKEEYLKLLSCLCGILQQFYCEIEQFLHNPEGHSTF